MVLSTVLEVANRASHHSRKFCVHSYKRVFVYNISYQIELVFQVLLPYFSNPQGFTRRRFTGQAFHNHKYLRILYLANMTPQQGTEPG